MLLRPLPYPQAERLVTAGVSLPDFDDRAGDVLAMIVGRGVALAAIGAGLGLLASLALSGLLTSLLYGASSTDPVSFAAVALFLLAVAALASYIPARRASRVDPSEALRYE
ncbi:MAG TPA: FtsX-like permease family protein [Vicinamibacteria bacterium]|nr:FtsX-like permease family protein [Vicinamibacteria bacterium]